MQYEKDAGGLRHNILFYPAKCTYCLEIVVGKNKNTFIDLLTECNSNQAEE